MGIILRGYGKRVLETEPTAATLTMRERILRNVEDAIRKVMSRAGATLSGSENESQGVEVTHAGTYTGLVYRRYRVTVLVEGVSGVAQVNCFDIGGASPADDGPFSQVVSSGVAFNVGSLGMSLTLNFSGTLKDGDYWDLVVGPYQSNVLDTSRQENDRQSSNIGVFVVLQEPLESASEEPVGYTTKSMTLTALVTFNRVSDPETYLEALLGDLESAVLEDWTRAGLAIDTNVQTNQAMARDEVSQYGMFTFSFEVLYRHRYGDPWTQ